MKVAGVDLESLVALLSGDLTAIFGRSGLVINLDGFCGLIAEHLHFLLKGNRLLPLNMRAS